MHAQQERSSAASLMVAPDDGWTGLSAGGALTLPQAVSRAAAFRKNDCTDMKLLLRAKAVPEEKDSIFCLIINGKKVNQQAGGHETLVVWFSGRCEPNHPTTSACQGVDAYCFNQHFISFWTFQTKGMVLIANSSIAYDRISLDLTNWLKMFCLRWSRPIHFSLNSHPLPVKGFFSHFPVNTVILK